MFCYEDAVSLSLSHLHDPLAVAISETSSASRLEDAPVVMSTCERCIEIASASTDDCLFHEGDTD